MVSSTLSFCECVLDREAEGYMQNIFLHHGLVLVAVRVLNINFETFSQETLINFKEVRNSNLASSDFNALVAFHPLGEDHAYIGRCSSSVETTVFQMLILKANNLYSFTPISIT